MQDVSQGRERIRKWPDGRPKNKGRTATPNQAKFAAAQLASKYMAPQIGKWAMDQVEGSPLLPRDVITAMMYNRLFIFDLDDGRTLWPMPARTDVSDALDVLGANVGDTLKRGERGWETVAGGGDPYGLKWQVLEHWKASIDGPVNQIDLNVSNYTDLRIFGSAVTCNVSRLRAVRFSVDGGATYISSANYLVISETGTISASEDAAYMHSTASAAARYCWLMMTGLGGPFAQYMSPRLLNRYFGVFNSSNPITNIRITPLAQPAQFNGGEIIIMAR